MKHFQDEDAEDDYGSLVFKHWQEDKDTEDDYGSLVFKHWQEDEDDYESEQIKHFQE